MKTFFSILLFICSFLLFGQSEVQNGLLFPDFTKGTVIYKNGSQTPSSLNYHTIKEQMLFEGENGSILAFAKPNEISAVIIDNRLFEYAAREAFYERIDCGSCSFYIRWKSNITSQGKTAGYGGSSQLSSVSNVQQIHTGSGYSVRLNTEEKLNVKTENSYFLKINKKYKRFTSGKSLAKLIKGDEKEVESFTKEENIDFNNIEDIKKVIEYCCSLVDRN